jgi:hypothetical protein
MPLLIVNTTGRKIIALVVLQQRYIPGAATGK